MAWETNIEDVKQRIKEINKTKEPGELGKNGCYPAPKPEDLEDDPPSRNRE
jgi:hypothetical protein